MNKTNKKYKCTRCMGAGMYRYWDFEERLDVTITCKQCKGIGKCKYKENIRNHEGYVKKSHYKYL